MTSSKFNSTAVSKVCHFKNINVLISDKMPSGQLLKVLKDFDVEISIAEPHK